MILRGRILGSSHLWKRPCLPASPQAILAAGTFGRSNVAASTWGSLGCGAGAWSCRLLAQGVRIELECSEDLKKGIHS